MTASTEYYRVFAYGHGHGALISQRFSREDAERCCREWQNSMPDADIRTERVNADGWAITSLARVDAKCPVSVVPAR